MWSKRALIILLALLVSVVGLTRTSYAGEWSFSPYRAQFSKAPAEQQTPDKPAAPENLQKKNIGRGVLFSLVIPGTGQLYAGSWLRAVPWFLIEAGAWAAFAHYHGAGNDKTNEFEAYADGHFSKNIYMMREFQVAKMNLGEDTLSANQYTLETWMAEDHDVRERYLPAPYTHDVSTEDRQQYYEMIGKYLKQFGFGWSDAYVGDTSNPDAYIWLDEPNTIEFDETTPAAMFFFYRDMRGEANDLLDKGNAAMEIVLVNHVLSALDAAFTVRSHNKHVSPSPSVGDLKLHYDARAENGGITRYLTLSLPLD